jgi:hypothetical protein
MGFLENLQKLPEQKRKIILWTVVVIFGVSFFIVWLISARNAIRNFPREDFFQKFEGPKIPQMPKFEIPEPNLSEEELKALEELDKMIKEQEAQKVQNQ